MSAGGTPAVLFYLLDRHALLAMTMGSKCIFLNSLTTPGCAHPSNGGELATYRRGLKFPSAEGWHEVPGWSLYPPVVQSTPPPALEPPTQTMFARGPVGGGHCGMVRGE